MCRFVVHPNCCLCHEQARRDCDLGCNNSWRRGILALTVRVCPNTQRHDGQGRKPNTGKYRPHPRKPRAKGIARRGGHFILAICSGYLQWVFAVGFCDLLQFVLQFAVPRVLVEYWCVYNRVIIYIHVQYGS
jgi:hypothetical protein